MPDITGFSHVSFTVSDRSRSAAWYQDVLGFEHHSEVEAEGFTRTRLRHPATGLVLTLTEHERGSGDRFDEARTGLDHLSLATSGVDDVKAWKRRFEERGVNHSEIKEMGSGAAMITLRDPDNIQLEVFGAQ